VADAAAVLRGLRQRVAFAQLLNDRSELRGPSRLPAQAAARQRARPRTSGRLAGDLRIFVIELALQG